jgi:hypothetical protein
VEALEALDTFALEAPKSGQAHILGSGEKGARNSPPGLPFSATFSLVSGLVVRAPLRAGKCMSSQAGV